MLQEYLECRCADSDSCRDAGGASAEMIGDKCSFKGSVPLPLSICTHPFPPFGQPRLPDEIPHQEKTAAHTCQGQRKRRRFLVLPLPVFIQPITVFVKPHLDNIPLVDSLEDVLGDWKTDWFGIVRGTWESQIQMISRRRRACPPVLSPSRSTVVDLANLPFDACFPFRTVLPDFRSGLEQHCRRQPLQRKEPCETAQDSQTNITCAFQSRFSVHVKAHPFCIGFVVFMESLWNAGCQFPSSRRRGARQRESRGARAFGAVEKLKGRKVEQCPRLDGGWGCERGGGAIMPPSWIQDGRSK